MTTATILAIVFGAASAGWTTWLAVRWGRAKWAGLLTIKDWEARNARLQDAAAKAQGERDNAAVKAWGERDNAYKLALEQMGYACQTEIAELIQRLDLIEQRVQPIEDATAERKKKLAIIRNMAENSPRGSVTASI